MELTQAAVDGEQMLLLSQRFIASAEGSLQSKKHLGAAFDRRLQVRCVLLEGLRLHVAGQLEEELRGHPACADEVILQR